MTPDLTECQKRARDWYREHGSFIDGSVSYVDEEEKRLQQELIDRVRGLLEEAGIDGPWIDWDEKAISALPGEGQKRADIWSFRVVFYSSSWFIDHPDTHLPPYRINLYVEAGENVSEDKVVAKYATITEALEASGAFLQVFEPSLSHSETTYAEPWDPESDYWTAYQSRIYCAGYAICDKKWWRRLAGSKGRGRRPECR